MIAVVAAMGEANNSTVTATARSTGRHIHIKSKLSPGPPSSFRNNAVAKLGRPAA
jgi:hypothetical protein